MKYRWRVDERLLMWRDKYINLTGFWEDTFISLAATFFAIIPFTIRLSVSAAPSRVFGTLTTGSDSATPPVPLVRWCDNRCASADRAGCNICRRTSLSGPPATTPATTPAMCVGTPTSASDNDVPQPSSESTSGFGFSAMLCCRSLCCEAMVWLLCWRMQAGRDPISELHSLSQALWRANLTLRQELRISGDALGWGYVLFSWI